MNIHEATRRYETWLGKQITLVPQDLRLKHDLMKQSVFPFLRATFYRRCQIWPEVCPDLAQAPAVLAVGDLHVENFGTWRDGEGRLVWGINDFDEASAMPYTMDLVRLAASAHLAIGANNLRIKSGDACASILSGYTDALKSGGCPIVLGEHHRWLRELAINESRDPLKFWNKMDELPTVKQRAPRHAIGAIEALMPDRGMNYRLTHRIAGLGSLGRERYMVIANWHGGRIAREAKALAISAYAWGQKGRGKLEILYEEIINRAIRCRDPFVRVSGRWVVRRLAPDCSRIELSSLPKKRDEARLLYEMGWETGNIHLGSKKAVKMVLRDLRRRRGKWLYAAARAMGQQTIADWESWRKSE